MYPCRFFCVLELSHRTWLNSRMPTFILRFSILTFLSFPVMNRLLTCLFCLVVHFKFTFVVSMVIVFVREWGFCMLTTWTVPLFVYDCTFLSALDFRFLWALGCTILVATIWIVKRKPLRRFNVVVLLWLSISSWRS